MMKRYWFQRVCGLLCIGLLLISCGYTMSSRSDGVSARGEPLSISAVESEVSPPRPELTYDLTRRLKEEAAVDKRFRLTGGANGAIDVRVALIEFREPTAVRSFTNETTEVVLSAVARLRIASQDSIREVEVGASGNYAPGLGESRDAALERLWRDLSRNVLDAIADRDWVEQK